MDTVCCVDRHRHGILPVSGPKEILCVQTLAVGQKPAFLRNVRSWFPSTKRAISLITGRRDELLMVPVSIPKHRLASRTPQYHKYLIHLSESKLAGTLTLLTTPNPNFLISGAAFPSPPRLLLFLITLQCWLCSLLGALSVFSFAFSPLCSCFSPTQVQSVSHVQSPAFSLCSRLFEMPLAVLPLIATIKTFP